MTTPDNPRQSAELVPKVYDAEVVSDNDITSGGRWSGLVLRRVAGGCTGYVVRESERVARLRSVTVYRVRKAPRDLVRLVWFVLRGHGRWIAKGWTWATHGDLRTDVRAGRLAERRADTLTSAGGRPRRRHGTLGQARNRVAPHSDQ